MERDCKKCVHHISGNCDAWECNMQTLKDYRNAVIDEFAELALTQFERFDVEHGYPTVMDCKDILGDIAEKMREVQNE